MKSIKISGDNKEVLSVELKDILMSIINGDHLKWSILWLEAIGEVGKPMADFEKEIRNSEQGLLIEWNHLLEFSKKIDQVIEITLLGDTNVSKLRRYPDDETMYSSCEYTIELVDSSYWIVHAINDQRLDSFKHLKGIEIIGLP